MLGYLSFVALSAALAGGVLTARLVLRPTAAGVPAVILNAEQDECPPIDAFSRADHWSVSLSGVPPDQVWPRLRQALDAWRKQYFPEDTSSLPALVLERDASPQQRTSRLDAYEARTCFFRVRQAPRVQYRVALAFKILEPTSRDATTLEVRWLSGIKGAGERTWTIDRERVGPLVEDLVRRLKQP